MFCCLCITSQIQKCFLGEGFADVCMEWESIKREGSGQYHFQSLAWWHAWGCDVLPGWFSEESSSTSSASSVGQDYFASSSWEKLCFYSVFSRYRQIINPFMADFFLFALSAPVYCLPLCMFWGITPVFFCFQLCSLYFIYFWKLPLSFVM